ncbi:hypothetical protein RBB77_01080 [Tunturibacter psychrotolerans]|uniref:Uncharacterized protein n=1 Tax=Tunturiibacter psychrotolerans TaxID=3069686 RepID=A0AAU7ZR98_9BACT
MADNTSSLRLRIFDGTRQLFSKQTSFLVSIVDGQQEQQIREFYTTNDMTFEGLPFYDNLFDNYTVLVSADGYQQAGYVPVKLSNQYEKTLDIMLIANDPGFSFVNARWPEALAAYPFLGGDVSDATGAARYDDLLDKTEKSLACLLNLGEAMSQIALSQGTPLDYIKEVRWDAPYAPAQDRFFGWCDVRLIDQVKVAAAAGKFAVENAPGLFHPGATSSWKQIQFGEANVQLTFHENDTKMIDGVSCVMIEPDIDYYRDPAAHVILEVVPNALTHSLTEPAQVYVLRWIAGQTAGIPEFAPLYTIT